MQKEGIKPAKVDRNSKVITWIMREGNLIQVEEPVLKRDTFPKTLFDSNSVKEKKEKEAIKWVNVTPEQKRDIQETLDLTGVRMDNVKTIRYSENAENEKGVIASYDLVTKEMVVKSDWYRITAEARAGALGHEIYGHSLTAFNPENDKFYGVGVRGKEIREEIANDVLMVANQTLETHKYLSTYHKMLIQEFEASKKTEQDKFKLLVETEAIMRQEVIENPNHLKQVFESQKAVMNRRGKQAIDIVALSEKCLLAVAPQFEGKADAMREYFLNMRAKIEAKYGHRPHEFDRKERDRNASQVMLGIV